MFVGPIPQKSSLPSLYKFLVQRILIHAIWIAQSLCYTAVDGPATTRCVRKVLVRWYICWFPSVQLPEANEAHHIVGIRALRLVKEAGSRHLEGVNQSDIALLQKLLRLPLLLEVL
jgi:hypothetical protein